MHGRRQAQGEETLEVCCVALACKCACVGTLSAVLHDPHGLLHDLSDLQFEQTLLLDLDGLLYLVP